MSHAEAIQWHAYLKKRGTLNLGMRMEAGFALLAAMISRALGGQGEVRDFMPHADPAPVESDLSEVMKILAGH